MTIARTPMTTSRISHTPADMTQWTGRAEPFETARARYWYQLAQPYEAQHIGLIGFACDQGVRRNQGRVGARAAPPLICNNVLIVNYQPYWVMLVTFIVMIMTTLPRAPLSKLSSNMPMQ